MATFGLYGYQPFVSFQFIAQNQVARKPYHNTYARRDATVVPSYPTQSYYQPSFYPVQGYGSMNFRQYPPYSARNPMLTVANRSDQYNQHAYHMNMLRKIEKRYWRHQGDRLPPTIYSNPLTTFNGNDPTVYEFIKERKYIPVPVYIKSHGNGSHTATIGNAIYRNRSLGHHPAIGYGNTFNNNFGINEPMNLPPKIRVIFMPMNQPSFQQPYIGPLTTPPFLYNRIAQPLCAFALPPPLPQLGSLPLTSAVQQMVVQQYRNPVAILPFASNWQMPQYSTFGFSQMNQQAYQNMSISNCQSTTQPSMPQFPSLPPAPQSFIPAPPTAPPPAPILGIGCAPPLPRLDIHPPVLTPNLPTVLAAQQPEMPTYSVINTDAQILSSLSNQVAVPNPTLGSTSSQFSNGGYPSVCRACPPAPPPLNVPVSGHCWIQHCAACHHVPTTDMNPNIRPCTGRITPLLRYPTVPHYVPDQSKQQQYLHSNPPIIMRPWLRKTPPLPPGAIIISDNYVTGQESNLRYNPLSIQYTHKSSPKYRSRTVAPPIMSFCNRRNTKNDRSSSPRKKLKRNEDVTQHRIYAKLKQQKAISSSGISSTGEAPLYREIIIDPSSCTDQTVSKELNNETSNINLKYNYQPEDLSAVYLLNRYLKSASNTSKSSEDSNSIVDECSFNSSASDIANLSKQISKSNKLRKMTIRALSPLQGSNVKIIVIREYISSSPSTISTISSDMTFRVLDKDNDSISKTNTITENNLDDDDGLTHTF